MSKPARTRRVKADPSPRTPIRPSRATSRPPHVLPAKGRTDTIEAKLLWHSCGANAWAVWTHMSRYVNATDNVTHVSTARLAAEIGLRPRQIERARQKLIKIGILRYKPLQWRGDVLDPEAPAQPWTVGLVNTWEVLALCPASYMDPVPPTYLVRFPVLDRDENGEPQGHLRVFLHVRPAHSRPICGHGGLRPRSGRPRKDGTPKATPRRLADKRTRGVLQILLRDSAPRSVRRTVPRRSGKFRAESSAGIRPEGSPVRRFGASGAVRIARLGGLRAYLARNQTGEPIGDPSAPLGFSPEENPAGTGPATGAGPGLRPDLRGALPPGPPFLDPSEYRGQPGWSAYHAALVGERWSLDDHETELPRQRGRLRRLRRTEPVEPAPSLHIGEALRTWKRSSEPLGVRVPPLASWSARTPLPAPVVSARLQASGYPGSLALLIPKCSYPSFPDLSPTEHEDTQALQVLLGVRVALSGLNASRATRAAGFPGASAGLLQPGSASRTLKWSRTTASTLGKLSGASMLRRVAKLLVEHEMNPMVWLVWRAKQWEGDGEPPLGFLLAPNLLAQGRFRGLARSQTPPTGLMQYKPRLHRELLVGRWEELRGYVGMLREDAPAGSMALLTASIFPLDELQRLQAAYADAAKVALYEAWRNMQHGQWIWPTY